MVVYKSINNNIVSAIDDNGREVVVIGKGVGYRAVEGTKIPPKKIEKVFVMSNPDNMERLKELFASLRMEYIEVTDEIISYAKKSLQKRLNESLYFTLADHINFSVTRMKQGMPFTNVLLTEVRSFYTEEFEIGLYALGVIKKKLGLVMPEDEAASIALHILNGEYDISISNAFHAAKLLAQIIDIIAKETKHTVEPKNYYYERFITHLKFLTLRIVRHDVIPDGDDEFFDLLAKQYPEEMMCAETIAAEILSGYEYSLSKQEVSSLTMHIKRIQG